MGTKFQFDFRDTEMATNSIWLHLSEDILSCVCCKQKQSGVCEWVQNHQACACILYTPTQVFVDTHKHTQITSHIACSWSNETTVLNHDVISHFLSVRFQIFATGKRTPNFGHERNQVLAAQNIKETTHNHSTCV